MMRAGGGHDAAIIAADPALVTPITEVALRLLLIPGGGQGAALYLFDEEAAAMSGSARC
jgi:hypothetical protein